MLCYQTVPTPSSCLFLHCKTLYRTHIHAGQVDKVTHTRKILFSDHDFVNEFLFAPPTPSSFHQRSFPGDLVWLVSLPIWLGRFQATTWSSAEVAIFIFYFWIATSVFLWEKAQAYQGWDDCDECKWEKAQAYQGWDDCDECKLVFVEFLCVMENESELMYVCDGFCIHTHTRVHALNMGCAIDSVYTLIFRYRYVQLVIYTLHVYLSLHISHSIYYYMWSG